ncbi:MAG: homogentisate 1,2-dioxygenase [bacterium]|nr:homogentisate 1,2-dioxygenase [bacterium]
MKNAPVMAGFPYQKRVRKGYEDKITFPLNGRAPKGLYNYKLEFGAEIICENSPSVVYQSEYSRKSDSLSRASLLVQQENMKLERRAFDLEKISHDLHSLEFPRGLYVGDDIAVSLFNGRHDAHNIYRHEGAYTLGFVHRGHGKIFTDFGLLSYEKGDFFFIPRGVTYAFLEERDAFILLYECSSRIMRPSHYWVDGYPFSPAAFEIAEPVPLADIFRGPYHFVRVKKHVGREACLWYPFSPFTAVAWEGDLYPFVLHLKDLRALSSADFHLDPKALTIFVTEDEGASVQAFLPRWGHSLPYPHQNYVTELLFNHRGYNVRPEIQDGCITLHPPGTYHGPDIRALDKQRTEDPPKPENLPWLDQVAIMLETKSSLVVLPAAEGCEIKDYEISWYRQWREIQKEKK